MLCGGVHMPEIRPIKDLRNTNEISRICHESNEPVYITKNGYGHLVVMSMETYKEKLAKADLYEKLAKADLYEKLAEAEMELSNREGRIDAEMVFESLRSKCGEK